MILRRVGVGGSPGGVGGFGPGSSMRDIDPYFFFALPPLRPPLRELAWLDFFPRPLPPFLPPFVLLVNSRPSAAFSFLFGRSMLFVAFLNVFSLTFLL